MDPAYPASPPRRRTSVRSSSAIVLLALALAACDAAERGMAKAPCPVSHDAAADDRPAMSPRSPDLPDLPDLPDPPSASPESGDGLLRDVVHRISHERAPGCDATAALSDLTWHAGLDGIPGRMELTRCDTARAGVSVYLDGTLVLAAANDGGPRPARLHGQTASIYLSRPGNLRGASRSWLVARDGPGLDLTASGSVLLALAEHRRRLEQVPAACPDCAEALDDLAYTLEATLRLACLEARGWNSDDRSVCSATP